MTALSSRFTPPFAARSARFGLSLAAATLALVAEPGTAAAEDRDTSRTVIGVGLNYDDSMADDDTSNGWGVDAYFGPRMDLAILTLTTEIAAGYHDFDGALDPTVYRAMVGGSIGIGVVVRPSVFAHIGVGHLRFDEPLGNDRVGRTNVAADVGAALDFTILPLVDIGIDGSYNLVGGNDDYDAFEWLQTGVHVTFVLDGD